MPTKYVRPYSKGQKNDFNDAEAMPEAVQRPTMKFVATNALPRVKLLNLRLPIGRWTLAVPVFSAMWPCREAAGRKCAVSHGLAFTAAISSKISEMVLTPISLRDS
jgi:hypothetical protein